MALEIKINKKKNYIYFVELKGSLDSDTYHKLQERLSEIIDDNTKAVILDMGGIDYISSAGIGVVMSTKKSLQQKNANFAMVNLQPQIKKVFDVMKILPMIDILDDMPGADKYIDQIIKEEIGKQAK